MRRITRDIITGACLLRWIVRDIIAGAAVVFPRNFHRAVLSSKKKIGTNQCTKKSRLYSLEKALSAYLSMQYKNRSRSPIRSLSLAVVVLHCLFAREGPVRLPQHAVHKSLEKPYPLPQLSSRRSPLLTPRVQFAAIPVKTCKPIQNSDIVFRGPGLVTIR